MIHLIRICAPNETVKYDQSVTQLGFESSPSISVEILFKSAHATVDGRTFWTNLCSQRCFCLRPFFFSVKPGPMGPLSVIATLQCAVKGTGPQRELNPPGNWIESGNWHTLSAAFLEASRDQGGLKTCRITAPGGVKTALLDFHWSRIFRKFGPL